MLQLVQFFLPLVEAAALTFARPLGFIIAFPLFAWLGLQGMVRNVTAIAFGSPFLVLIYAQIIQSPEPLAAEYVVLLTGKEFLVGITLGLLLGVPFWAAEMAGAYVDVYRGTSAATVVSPDQMSEPLVSGALFSIALVAIFLAMGGLRMVLGLLYESYEIWPYFELLPQITGELYPVFIELLGTIARIALSLGAPIMIAMFIGELALAFTSRFAPQINIFDAMLSIKNIIFLLILPPYLYLLARHYGPDVLDLPGLIDIARKLVQP
jgi:type III secretion protein T